MQFESAIHCLEWSQGKIKLIASKPTVILPKCKNPSSLGILSAFCRKIHLKQLRNEQQITPLQKVTTDCFSNGAQTPWQQGLLQGSSRLPITQLQVELENWTKECGLAALEKKEKRSVLELSAPLHKRQISGIFVVLSLPLPDVKLTKL